MFIPYLQRGCLYVFHTLSSGTSLRPAHHSPIQMVDATSRSCRRWRLATKKSCLGSGGYNALPQGKDQQLLNLCSTILQSYHALSNHSLVGSAKAFSLPRQTKGASFGHCRWQWASSAKYLKSPPQRQYYEVISRLLKSRWLSKFVWSEMV